MVVSAAQSTFSLTLHFTASATRSFVTSHPPPLTGPASKIVGTYVPDSDEDDDGGSGASSKKRSSDASENESKAENAKKSKK
jgi:hypothetical protein